MLTLRIKEKDYQLKFGYKAIGKSGILKEVVAIRKMLADKKKDIPDGTEEDGSEMVDMIGDIFDITSRLVLAALQKYNPDYRVAYDSPVSVNAGIEKVYDFMDDYMDEEDSMDITTLFSELVNELFNNGFLSRKSEKLETALIEQNATVAPTDHLLPMN